MIHEFERKYTDFNQFCMYIKTPDDLIGWFNHNKFIWNRTGEESIDPNDYPFAFPDDIIKDKEGICYDIALFVYYFCKRHRIPVRIGRVAIYLKLKDHDNYWCWGHVIGVYSLDKKFYVFNYSENISMSKIYGAYISWDEAINEYSKIFYDECYSFAKNRYDLNDVKGPFSGYIKPEGYQYIDLIYNNHDITQNQFIEMFPDAYVRFELDE